VWNRRQCSQWCVEFARWRPPPLAANGIDVGPGSEEELSSFRRAWSDGPLPEAFSADLTFGLKRCCLGYRGGRVAHISWFTADRWTFALDHRPTDWEIRDVFTLPRDRGQGIATYVLTTILATLQKEDAERVFAHVDVGNLPSERTMERIGMKRVGCVRRTRLLGFERLRSHLD